MTAIGRHSHVALASVLLAVALGTLPLLPQSAGASSAGITNFSGKRSFHCASECHVGGDPPGIPPLVEFEGPSTMTIGSMATFRFRITSRLATDQTHAGFNVASSAGVIGLSDAGGTRTEVVFGSVEITHMMPRANNSRGVAEFEFTWRAPDTAGTYTLYGAGNSVNHNGNAFGDGVSRATLQINVAGPPTQTPTRTPTTTRTPTVTATVTPTRTATQTPTPSETATPTPTIAAGPCVGDCDLGGQVTVDEIVTGVNIALGIASVQNCLAFDRDGSTTVTVDELVEAIQRALGGCQGAAAANVP
jgi:hypothetical protein